MPEDISFLLLPGFSAIGFMSAAEPLRVANRFCDDLYRWRILSMDGASVMASNGISLNAEAAFHAADPRTVFVVAGFDPLACYSRALAAWLRRLARAGATLGGIDTGSFVLAEAGLFCATDRLTLHWEALSAFRERYPALRASQELFEIGAKRITCAGGTASIDMMLDLIGRSHGAALAAAVSEQFVVGRIRQRSDHQRMQIAARYGVHNRKLIQVIGAMEQNMEEPLAPDALAQEVGVTRRQLERLFCAALEDTPKHFYRQLRLERARELLQQTDMTVTSICVACGFESPSHFSRTYRAKFGTSPRRDRSPARATARVPHARTTS
ncbi:GlxA family transcriptional regulator [Verminephrobacter aporrectodeae subsp. tuberculatae]|uniref:GlxA family transcriptional regulator n=1 Tax=Verminephrobacter aporrectodeae subsp. tuberculatae TaxID=1110392 RepID=A0ABT3KSA7_9BURK|nr:GlxA family transcriptional regulator [Verminephrobacter aporrectodeae]MCW5220364.1 GlxA family transcriptional regulator [Verminephrobacter aporrectodeae subsp. tuberculatae]MCW5255672.1 GlxA family transcriptional regulator [Verminephrobacter aporrectodeae subsp. tuberculatae]MCW5289660.1 GlxA family transcriptional regulator [Verminephrobacter aporrectodeae subsp. tuberculatae]MCW5320690.1 GlxA family transcriptional regulator [Verminephrobacter aporrectodeae subsp. tuberculatae]MCW81669